MRVQSERVGSRKARDVLERLAEGGVLCRVESGQFRLYTENAKGLVPVLDVDRGIVEALLKNELLDPVDRPPAGKARHGHPLNLPQRDRRLQGTALKLSPIGRMHLRRRHAGGGTGFAAQHRHMDTVYMAATDKANQRYNVNVGESPLGWLKTRKDANGRPLISDAQYDAGEALRADYTLANLTPRITTNWQSIRLGTGGGQGGQESGLAVRDAALKARDRVYQALAFAGPGLAEVLLETCCYLNGIEQAERNLGWPRRSGKIVLQIALDRLASHYRLGVDGGA